MGRCYYEGDKGLSNLNLAAEWFTKAAAQGNAYSQGSLGFLYSRGLGVVQNEAEGVRLSRLAAKQCSAGAMFNLA